MENPIIATGYWLLCKAIVGECGLTNKKGAHMSYDRNDLGYDTGYDSDFIRQPAKPAERQMHPQHNPVVYYMIDSATATDYKPVEGAHALQVPTDDDKPGKIKAMNDKGEVQEFSSESEATSKGFKPFQVKLDGKTKDGGYLVQYFDGKNNPLKYDQVDRKTAEKMGIQKAELDSAKPIDSDTTSFFAKQATDLKKVESTKTADLPDFGVAATSASKIEADANAARWEPGKGAFDQRLRTEYRMSDTEVDFCKKQYGSDPTKFNEKFPPLTDAQKADSKEQQKVLDKAKSQVIEDTIQAQGTELERNVNSKKGPDDPTRMKPGEGASIVRQQYREAGFTGIDKKEPDFKSFTDPGLQTKVTDKIDGFKATSAPNKVDPKVSAAQDDAFVKEKDALVSDVEAQMPKKITKKVGGKDTDVTLTQEEKHKYAVAYVQKQRDKGDLKTADDVKAFRAKFNSGDKEANTKMLRYESEVYSADGGDQLLGKRLDDAGVKDKGKTLDGPTQKKVDEAAASAGAQKKSTDEAALEGEKKQAAQMRDPDVKQDPDKPVFIDTTKQGWRDKYLRAQGNVNAQSQVEADKMRAGQMFDPDWKPDPKKPDAKPTMIDTTQVGWQDKYKRALDKLEIEKSNKISDYQTKNQMGSQLFSNFSNWGMQEASKNWDGIRTMLLSKIQQMNQDASKQVDKSNELLAQMGQGAANALFQRRT